MSGEIFNLYASSVSAEHPLVVWPLDEDLGYISLIDVSPSWSGSTSFGTINALFPAETVGLADELVQGYTFYSGSAVTQTFTVASDRSAAVGTFLYSTDAISRIDIGFIKAGVEEYTSFVPSTGWIRVEHTTERTGLQQAFIRVTYESYVTNGRFYTYKFTVGEWSELYNVYSEGFIPVGTSLSAALGLSASCEVVPIDSYGITDDGGYYVVENGRPLALNSTLPMVYGSGNVTEVFESDTPAIILPGQGFLNQQFRNYTAEFWLRLAPSSTLTKIFGPLEGLDGLYSDDGYLTMRVGPYEQAWYMGLTYRPMLIDVCYMPNRALLMVNGETVIDMTIDSRDVTFAGQSDWLGFWGCGVMHLDCPAIFPYVVPPSSAKRRFVYGQAVGSSVPLVKKFGGVVSEIDFSFANYAANVIYPDVSRWSAGYFSNMDAGLQLKFPDYTLPSINYYGEDLSVFNQQRVLRTWGTVAERTWADWATMPWRNVATIREANVFYDNYPQQENWTGQPYIRLKPTSGYDDIYGSIDFDFPFSASSVYAIMSINSAENSGDDQVLMRFAHRTNGNVFTISINGTSDLIEYAYNGTVLKTVGIAIPSDDSVFVVGLRFEDFGESYYRTIRKFFSNLGALKFNVGGYETSTFGGKIYKVVFDNKRFDNLYNGSMFDSDGTALTQNAVYGSFDSDIMDRIGNYTLLFRKTNSAVVMDIGCVGYWEDSVPMSTLGTYVNINGETRYDLDIVQFNIDTPTSIFTNGENPDDVKVYVTVQRYQDAGGVGYGTYSVTEPLVDRIVTFDGDPDTTKFEVVDGSVIIPPKDLVDFDKGYLTFHIEAQTRGLNTRPLAISRMSLSSIGLGDEIFKIGSADGNAAYPFTRKDANYMTKAANPFVIYRDSTPYLYNSGNSGVLSLPVDSDLVRGLSVPLNPTRKDPYSFYGFHLWVRWTEEEIESERAFGIRTNSQNLNFYIEPEGERGRLTGMLEIFGGEREADLSFYQNGTAIVSPVIMPGIWTMITVVLDSPITLTGEIGQLEIGQSLAVDNIAVYEEDISLKVDDIFESHLGLSSIVVSDPGTVVLNSENLHVYSGVQWTDFVGKAI